MTLFTSEMKMKSILTRLAILSAICLLCVSVGMATPACGTSSGTIPASAKLNPLYVDSNGDTYLPLPGYVCDIGNLQFSNFFYSDANSIPPSQVTVTPETTTGDQGLKFSGGPFSVGPGQSDDVTISFTVTALSGVIDDIGIDILGASTSGTGNINYLEQFCTTTGLNPVCSIFTDTPTGPLSTEILLSNTSLGGPVTSLNITKDVALVGGNGTANISAFDNNYSNVPEPRAVSVLLSLGLFAGVLFMKKRSQAARS